MSKAHRGTGVRNEPNHGRGTCPVCGRTEVKVLYEKDVDGKKVKVCKVCSAHMKNEAKKAAKVAKKAAAAEAPAADAPAASE
jgi:ribosome-binding protein aMBF1 (putative translation factor)